MSSVSGSGSGDSSRCTSSRDIAHPAALGGAAGTSPSRTPTPTPALPPIPALLSFLSRHYEASALSEIPAPLETLLCRALSDSSNPPPAPLLKRVVHSILPTTPKSFNSLLTSFPMLIPHVPVLPLPETILSQGERRGKNKLERFCCAPPHTSPHTRTQYKRWTWAPTSLLTAPLLTRRSPP